MVQGVILYGEPGTGKTLLAKAVANSTSASFLRVVGSELIQKYLGDGPKLVRELFRAADELSPSIVFIGKLTLDHMHPLSSTMCHCMNMHDLLLTNLSSRSAISLIWNIKKQICCALLDKIKKGILQRNLKPSWSDVKNHTLARCWGRHGISR